MMSKMVVEHLLRPLLSLRHSLTQQGHFGPISVHYTSFSFTRKLFSSDNRSNEPKLAANPENQSLVENLILLGVDLKMARQRQPGVLRKSFTNEQSLAKFLESKGASRSVIASIISRYPRAVTRSIDHLNQRWELWRNIFKTDAEIVNILDRSPESFFRSSDNGNLEKNIAFLTSLGLSTRDLHRLLTTAPRTFSNSLELNRQMVEFLQDICTELGGKNPEQFSKNIISRNLYILIRSTKRVKTNIDILRVFLQMSDSELLSLLQGSGAEILDLSSECLKKNSKSLQQKMYSLGCPEADIKQLVVNYPMVLYIGPSTLSAKLDCLLNGGITMNQILEKPKVLDYSTKNITGRLVELKRIGYDFQKKGINVLDSSQKRFIAKIEKLAASPEE